MQVFSDENTNWGALARVSFCTVATQRPTWRFALPSVTSAWDLYCGIWFVSCAFVRMGDRP